MRKMWLVLVGIGIILTKVSAEWTIQTIDTSGDVGKYACICSSPFSFGVSYYDSTNGDLKLATVGTEDVGPIIRIDTAGDMGKFTSIIAWEDTPNVWTSTNVLISYYDATNGNLKCAWKKCWLSDTFELLTIDTVGNVGMFTALYVDTIQKRPYISYYDETNGNLKLAYFADTGWIIQTVDTAGDVGKYNSISGYKDTIYISYYDSTNGDLKLAKYDEITWQIEKVDTAGDVGKYTSNIAGIFIDYYDAENGDLKEAERWQNNWIISKIDTLGDVGLFCNIEKQEIYRKEKNWRFIYYYDKTNGNLKCIGPGEVVDSICNVGGYCSGFNSGEIYLVVYYDFTNGDLKMASDGGAVEENKEELDNILLSITPTLSYRQFSISYYLSSPSYVNLKVFSTTGKLLEKVVDKKQNSGKYSILWKPQNLPNGIYFLQLRTNNLIKSKKVILIK